MRYKLIALGSGSCGTVGDNNWHSNFLLINERNETLLIDCGSDIRHSLYQSGFKFPDITDIFISHLHSDHVGGLEYIGLYKKFSNLPRPKLYLHPDLEKNIWEKTLSGGMETISSPPATLKTFFQVETIENNIFQWEDIKFKLITTKHHFHDGMQQPCFGLFFEINGLKILFTGDTQFSPIFFKECYKKADLILHDCKTNGCTGIVHPHYNQLRTLSQAVKEKIWLYHYNPGEKPNPKKDGFQGFVEKGKIFFL